MNRILSAPRTVTAVAITAARRAIERTAREAVPAFADFCLVHLVVGRTIRCVTAIHSTRVGGRDMPLIKTLRIRCDDRDSTVAHVVRTGRPTLRTEIHPEAPAGTRTGRIADLHRRLAPTSALVVPIVRDAAVLGALSLCYSHSGRAYRARHVPSAQRLATRIAATLIPSSPVGGPLGLRAPGRPAAHGAVARRRA